MAGIASGLVQKLLEKLSAKAYEEISLACNVQSDIKRLKGTILWIESVLLDAEEKQNHEHQVRYWLESLRNALYDAEDVLDEFECEAIRRKMAKQRWSNGQKIRYFFAINSNPIIFSFKMAHKIKMVNERLDDIATSSKSFNLVKKEVEHDFMHSVGNITHSFVDSSNVFGRKEDKEWIIKHLLDSNVEEKLSIISLVGIGGLGKTTLAQLVYNDESIIKHFTTRMWVCVSVDFDVWRLTREILSSVTHSKVSKDLSLDELQIRLRQELDGKKFLLVLDDVWNEDGNKWWNLKSFLMVGAKGSKIIVTTRMNSVAKIMSKDKFKHELDGLKKEDSWCLFAKCAFGDKEEEEIPHTLKLIGENIVDKCKGVPLAIKSLGNLLHSKTRIREWEYVRDSEMWKLEEKNDGILPALKLSYELMPSYLKPCFVYCALFPKDYNYNIDRVIRLWMANGMVHSKNESEELEDIGLRYYEELCSRSLFQQDESQLCPIFFKIHDLVHDLASSIAHDIYFTAQSITKSIPENTRHIYLSHIPDEDDPVSLYLPQLKKVRSFINHKDYSVFNNFLFLRVLEMSDLKCKTLQDEMNRLKHIRYLSLIDCSFLESLPNSVGELQSLQTLIVRNCPSLRRLPKDLRNLICLRYLWLETPKICTNEIFERIECLDNLQTLAIIKAQMNLKDAEEDSYRNEKVIQSRLRSLHLQFPDILPWFQRSANTLRHLEIGAIGVVKWPKWLSELSSLETLVLVLRANKGSASLFEGIERLSTLQMLIIKYYGIVGRRSSQEWKKIAHVPTIEINDELIKVDPKVLHRLNLEAYKARKELYNYKIRINIGNQKFPSWFDEGVVQGGSEVIREYFSGNEIISRAPIPLQGNIVSSVNFF